MSAQTDAALALVDAGRVSYGDAYPGRSARAVARGADPRSAFIGTFLVDGHEVYGGQHSTFAALTRRGLITADCDDDGTPHVVTRRDPAEPMPEPAPTPTPAPIDWRGGRSTPRRRTGAGDSSP